MYALVTTFILLDTHAESFGQCICIITSSIDSPIDASVIKDASYDVRMMAVRCSFVQSFYCVVCCSTDPSVPPDSRVHNISATRGTEVAVSLQGLTSGQMYYCKAAATDTISNNCAGPVVRGVFNFMIKLSHSDVMMLTSSVLS